MTPAEVVDLLAVIAACDRRTNGEADLVAYTAIVGDLPFDVCRDAVIEHYRSTRLWIMPSDIVDYVKRHRPGVHDRTVRELGLYRKPTPPNAEYLAKRRAMREGRATS